MTDTIFICKANVQRSQVAQWLYNHFSKKSKAISCAWAEARKEKYNFKPEKVITEILKNDWIDISNQEINYISDFNINDLKKLKNIIFLFDPIHETNTEKECLVNWLSPYEFFKNNNIWEIIINEIKDPYKLSIEETKRIYNEINDFVKSLVR